MTFARPDSSTLITGTVGDGPWAFEQYQPDFPRPRKVRRAHLLNEQGLPVCDQPPLSTRYRLISRGEYDAVTSDVITRAELPDWAHDSRRACRVCADLERRA